MSFDPTKTSAAALPLGRPKWLASAQAFDDFARQWETGTLAKTEWTHAAHVAIAARQFVLHRQSSLDRMRAGICHFNLATGTPNTESSGYHETLTRFWMAVVSRTLKDVADPWHAACVAVAELGSRRNLHTFYYSFEVVGSSEARRCWIAPDIEGPYGPIC